MHCGNCGASAGGDDTYCASCGHPISTTHAPPTPGGGRSRLAEAMQPDSQPLPLARPSGVIDSAPWSSGASSSAPTLGFSGQGSTGPQPTQAIPTPQRHAPGPDEFDYPALSAPTVGVGLPSTPTPATGPALASYHDTSYSDTPYNDTQLAPPQPSGSLPGAAGSGAVAQTAPIPTRVSATLLDSVIASALTSIGWAAAALIGVLASSLPWQAVLALMVLTVSFFLAIVLYNAIYRVGRTGQSWGKKLASVAVVDVGTGLPVGTGRALLRSLVLWLPVLGWLSVRFDGSGRGRGWADLASNARVLKVETGALC